MIAYPFIVTLEFEAGEDGPAERSYPIDAYSVTDAITQASVQLEYEERLIAKGGTGRVKSVTPDVDRAKANVREQVTQVVREMMPMAKGQH